MCDMAEIPNSQRSFLRATYTPIQPKEDQGGGHGVEVQLSRAWEKWSFVASLKPSLRELGDLRSRFVERSGQADIVSPSSIGDVLKGIEMIGSTIPRCGTPSALRDVSLFREIEPHSLIRIAQGLVELRQEQVESIIRAQQPLLEAFYKAQLPPALPKVLPSVPTSVAVEILGAFEKQEKRPSSGASTMVVNGQSQISTSLMASLNLQKLSRATSPVTPLALNTKTLMTWAVENNIESDTALKTLEFIEQLPMQADAVTPINFNDLASAYCDHQRKLLDGFRERIKIEPIGYLHLERIAYTPAGIERGELVYSVPLAPAEEVNISHKEWSNTSQEFETIVTDFLEQYSEEGVTEKSELAQSTNSQEQHTSGLNTGVTASGGYGSVSITTTVGYSATDSASSSEQTARSHSTTLTRKASSRVKKEHKVSFKVASAAGTEDQAVRRIKNPFTDRATRVDYYQLVRKWRVDLYRYGLRLTYDITIPEPGSDIISRVKEMQDIQRLLEVSFGDVNAPDWAKFDLLPDQITPENYLNKAAQYHAGLPPELVPPPRQMQIDSPPSTQHWSEDQSSHNDPQFFILEVEVDDRYEVTTATRDLIVHPNRHGDIEPYAETFPGGVDWVGGVDVTLYYRGKSGKISMAYVARTLHTLLVELHLTLTLKEDALVQWRLKVWNAIRDAALAYYNEYRGTLQQRLSQLAGEIGAQDALSLRKIEREEVMKGVLRWMFGPHLEFWPGDVPSLETVYNTATQTILDERNWSRVLALGELIKFLHHAIEWENMLYLLYPYFWSHPFDWELKKYLDHPDPLHRVFLKAGSARVVLTIRPGFEDAFTKLLETGSFFDALGEGHPYLTITEEMENYAKTNYPGIRPANPIQDARPLLYPKQRKAWEEMQIIMKLLDVSFQRNGHYPSALTDLQPLLPYDDGVHPRITDLPLQDPWGHNYVYTFPGVYSDYDLDSYGKDGVADSTPGGTDENADITSWAEASLIGTWYEYTPTSAMDIAFNETMPSA